MLFKSRIMITFFVAVIILIAGYFLYGKLAAHLFAPDPSRTTPAYSNNDGVDFKPMPTWKVFVIQFLNIAGLGPIFGAILGAAYGPAAYLWIVIGCIFLGAVHDFSAGMMSLRHNGSNMPDIAGDFLGPSMKWVANIVVCFLLLAIGVSFVTGPSGNKQRNLALDYIRLLPFCHPSSNRQDNRKHLSVYGSGPSSDGSRSCRGACGR